MADTSLDPEQNGTNELPIVNSMVDREDVTPEEAVQQIIKLTSTRTPDQLQNHVYFTGLSVVSASRCTAPEKQSRLVDFVFELRKHSVTDPATGAALILDGQEVWKHLPTMGWSFTDLLCSFPTHDPVPEDETITWENSIAFVAQADARSQDPDINWSHGSWSLNFLCFAFDYPDSWAHEVTVRLVCLWFIYDAQKMWNNIEQKANQYTLGNWQRWKRGLEEAALKIKDQRTKDMISKALVEIKRVERI
ncbi:hypothetical protein GQ44DRAFT_729205 [Phaeosphaeriaceae sp. PMI808]|nr:hypothetical protein GQ44DRAFT_729205 [Phaeosphaeriaceae sp. PMI808]